MDGFLEFENINIGKLHVIKYNQYIKATCITIFSKEIL